MARYRLGNSYLSEDEYEKALDGRFGCLAAFAVALAVGLGMSNLVVDPGWPKLMRFTLIGGSSLLASIAVFRFAAALRRLLILIVGLVVFAGALYLIWRIS
jgi:hypothetical protein